MKSYSDLCGIRGAGQRKPGRKYRKDTTVYNFDTIDVDGKPEVQFKCLKRLVGERGFEPPTPWSRTRCSTRLSHSPTVLRTVERKAFRMRALHVGRHLHYNIRNIRR